MLSQEFTQIDPREIIIPEGRQRRDASDTEDLQGSIKERGIINPIIVTKGLVLIAGERRTRAAIAVGLTSVPVRFDGELSPLERRIVELEENERRKELPWKDQVQALAELHELYSKKAEAAEESWSISKTADILFYNQSFMSKILRIYRDINNPRIESAPGVKAAYNILARLDERAVGDAMASISQAGQKIAAAQAAKQAAAQAQQAQPTPASGTSSQPTEPQRERESSQPEIGDEEKSILQVDFATWAETYEGPRFNFVHCDFPFGVNLFDGEQGGKNKWIGYDDDPNVYWSLIRAFCQHAERFMSDSAHLMFWLSADIETQHDTIELFNKLAPELSFGKKALIWHKSDNVGVLSDPKRGPRHIYETALIASRDDRYILQATSDLYSAPTDKAHHPSTKPEPMLRYFFRMFVDEHTYMLDPTCGSGAALRAAESLGARHVLGLEVNAEHCANARSALRQFRTKARLSK